jgi:serine protease
LACFAQIRTTNLTFPLTLMPRANFDRTIDHNEWVLDFCGIREAWIKTQGASIVVAHPDSGWSDHPELTPNYLTGEAKNFVNYNRLTGGYTNSAKDPLDGNFPGHGAATAAVLLSHEGPYRHGVEPKDHQIAQNHQDAFVTGVAPKASGIPFKVTIPGVTGINMYLIDLETEAIARSIYYCIDDLRFRNPNPLDVGVMSISLGTPNRKGHKPLRDALRKARNEGLIVIAAAGQALKFVSRPLFPSCNPNVIGVAACCIDDSGLWNGFYGPDVTISAAGEDVWMAEAKKPGPQFAVKRSHGSSYATAITAGACALWQAHHGRAKLINDYSRKLLFPLFKHCLQKSAFVPTTGWDATKRGAGILDVERLLNYQLPSRAFVETLP